MPIAKRATWHLFDANKQAVGRLASRIAHILQGKHRVDYAPTRDFGDTVVVVNLKYMLMAKNRLEGKRYYRHSGYPGGLKVIRAKELMKKRPERVLYLAVRGMLPKSAVLRKQRMTRLLMYRDSEHPHLAQLPPLPIVKEDLNVDPSLPMKEQIRLYEEIEEERLAALGITKEEKEARDRKAILEELAKAGISLPNAP